MRLTNKNLKKIINKVVNESMYVKRRAGEIESCFEKSDKHIIWHQHK